MLDGIKMNIVLGMMRVECHNVELLLRLYALYYGLIQAYVRF